MAATEPVAAFVTSRAAPSPVVRSRERTELWLSGKLRPSAKAP